MNALVFQKNGVKLIICRVSFPFSRITSTVGKAVVTSNRRLLIKKKLLVKEIAYAITSYLLGNFRVNRTNIILISSTHVRIQKLLYVFAHSIMIMMLHLPTLEWKAIHFPLLLVHYWGFASSCFLFTFTQMELKYYFSASTIVINRTK